MTYPFFIDMTFVDDSPNPLSEVKELALSYIAPRGLATPELFVMGTEDDRALWCKALEWVMGFGQQADRATIMPVGWNVRNLVWPAFVAHVAAAKGDRGFCDLLPGYLLQQKEKRWSNVDMVDVANLVMQGGYTQEPLKLEDAAWFFLGEKLDAEATAADRLWKVYDIYTKYV